jgi:hypothetical protein
MAQMAIQRAKVAAIAATQQDQAKQQIAAKAFVEQNAAEQIAASKAEKATQVELLKSDLRRFKKERALKETQIGSSYPRRKLPSTRTAKEAIEIGAKLRENSKQGESTWLESSLFGHLLDKDDAYQKEMWPGSHPHMSARETAAVREFSNGFDWLIREYSGGAKTKALIAGEIEHQLVNGKVITKAEAQRKVSRAIEDAHVIEAMFAKAKDSPVAVVYRGIGGFSDEYLNQLLGNDYFDMQGKPSSTSADPDISRGFMVSAMRAKTGHGVLLKLRRKTTVGTGFNKVSHFAEQEVLMHGNAQFRVISRRRVEDYLNRECWEIEAEEV